MKKYFPSLLIAVVGFGFITFGLMTNEPPIKKRKPVSIAYFKQGEMLLPSYACPDTLIVINAIELNKGMALIEQGIIDATDYQIDSLLHTTCKIK